MNNNINEAFSALKIYLQENYNAKSASGGKEIVKRCHFCGDSRNPSDAHMYIGIKDGRIVYNCFKCNASGLVDGSFLRNMGCYDLNLILLVKEQNLSSQNKSPNKSNRIFKSFIIPQSKYENNIPKLQYLSNRLGLNISFEDVSRFKVILSIKDFLSVNRLSPTRHNNIIDILDSYFIGFLSVDNSYIIMRRIIKEGHLPQNIDSRYINYNIYGDNFGTKFYILPNAIDINQQVEVHIAEGVLDILSIYLNVAYIGTNGVFAAICGKSYSSLVRYLILNYGLVSFALHIYPDSDIDINDIYRLRDDLKPFNISIYIHRNSYQNEKDYGVPKNRIIDSIIKI